MTFQTLSKDSKDRVLSELSYLVMTDSLRPVSKNKNWPDGTDFNERPQDIAQRYTEQATKQSQKIVDKWLATIENTINEVDTLDLDDRGKFSELQERLYALYEEMPGDEYGEILGEAIAAAEVAGRFEVIEDVPIEDIEF